MNIIQLKQTVIVPVLKSVDLYSESAANIICGICSVESDRGEFLIQNGSGIARGIFQMEPNTRKDIYDNFLKNRPSLKKQIDCWVVPNVDLDFQLVFNLAYAVIMTRVHLMRVSEPLPGANDLEGMARYWKRYYNSKYGAGKVEDFIKKYPLELLK